MFLPIPHAPANRTRLTAALVAAVLLCAPFAHAQERLALADRVARLEQQAQGNTPTVELLNRINELQQEVQSLRGALEQQTNEIARLNKIQDDKYADLSSRIERMSAPGGVSPGGAPPADASAPMEQRAPENGGGVPEDNGAQSGAAGEQIAPPMQDPGVGAPPVDAAEEKAAYDEAFAVLREGRYADSARLFQEFLDRFPNGDLADNAHYWLGESYYVTQNYKIALETFETVLSRFPQSPKAPDAMLKVGYCQFELKDWARAEATLNEVVRRYPDTTVSRLAEGRLRALRLESRRQ